jgi:hypothetical protein
MDDDIEVDMEPFLTTEEDKQMDRRRFSMSRAQHVVVHAPAAQSRNRQS